MHSESYIIVPRKIVLKNIDWTAVKSMGRNDECVCGSGKRSKSCHPRIEQNSFVGNLWKKYRTFDAKIREIVEKENISFICKKGCANCCCDYFYVSPLEYFIIKEYLLTCSPEIFEKTKVRGAWQLQQLKELYPAEWKRLVSTASLDDSFQDHAVIPDGARFFDCPFLCETERICKVYEVRPFICRLFGISSVYSMCRKLQKKQRSRFLLFSQKRKHFVDVAYDSEMQNDVDIFWVNGTQRCTRPYPLFYFLANDNDYEKIFEAALCSQEAFIKAEFQS